MNRKTLLFFLLLLNSAVLFAQTDEKIVVVGKTLFGKVIDGKQVREVIGNVVMTQGNVRITCDKAIQYLDNNEAELIGNVVAVQDTITIRTDKGYYYGNYKYSYSNTKVFLDDGHINLEASKGYYYFDDDRAEFYNDVVLKDTANTLWADKLIYYNDLDKAVSTGNVKIEDDKSQILADSLIHFRANDISIARSNIKISYPENNMIITGGYLEDRGRENYTLITNNPVLTQIDTTEESTPDTLIVLALKMEAFQDSSKRLIASDSVKVIRKDFYSVNNYTVFYREEDRIFTVKRESDKRQPIVWYDLSQLTGDTVNVKLKEKKIDWIDISGNSFILSKVEGFHERYNQISGNKTKMYFLNNELKTTEVFGNVLTYYYILEDDEANGVLKSSSERAKLIFTDNSISDVKLYGSIKSEYHPENLIKDKEKEFTLPAFVLYTNKPDKIAVKKSISNFKLNRE